MSHATAAPERVTLDAIAQRPCWVAWQTALRTPSDLKPTKIPYNPGNGNKAKADDPSTWGTRDQAKRHAALLPKPFGSGGIGLEFTDLNNGRRIGGVDLDSCRDAETGELAAWAQSIIDRLASYTEVSPSGTGVKVFFLYRTADAITIRTAMGLNSKGEPKHGSKWSRGGGDHAPGIEFYSSNRFFAVTGAILPGSTDELRCVETPHLLHVIKVEGPAFAAGSFSADCPGPSEPTACEVDATIKPQESGKPPSRRKRNIVGQDVTRSVQAFKIGAAARRDGADYATMCAAIRDNQTAGEWYQEKGVADGGRELRRIWEKTDPFTGDLILSAAAPLHSARQFIGRKHTLHGIGAGPTRTIHHQGGDFFTWQGSHYAEQAAEEMRAALYPFLDTALTYNDRDELVAFNPSKPKITNILEALAAEAQVPRSLRPPAWLDSTGSFRSRSACDVIACKNLLLHLPTGDTHPHTPLFFTRNALAFDYHPDAPAPARWLTFLASLWPTDPEAIATLQELFGLALTADTSHQKAFLLIGPKRSGKGTIARVLTELLGAANVCSPTLTSLSTNFGLSPLIGKRLAIISDARLSGRVDHALIAERLLAITGEDAQTVDRKYREAWTGKIDARFLVLTNELPRLTDSSGALASRFIVLTVVPSFYGREDRALLSKLLPELPGILRWAIEGWRRLNVRGHFIPPQSSDNAIRDLEDLGSPIGAFLRECCVVGPGKQERPANLYAAWREWCQEHGRDHPGTTQTFGRDLAAAVAGLKVVNLRTPNGARERFYEGVRLTTNWVERSGTRSSTLQPQPAYPTNGGPSHPQAHWHK